MEALQESRAQKEQESENTSRSTPTHIPFLLCYKAIHEARWKEKNNKELRQLSPAADRRFPDDRRKENDLTPTLLCVF